MIELPSTGQEVWVWKGDMLRKPFLATVSALANKEITFEKGGNARRGDLFDTLLEALEYKHASLVKSLTLNELQMGSERGGVLLTHEMAENVWEFYSGLPSIKTEEHAVYVAVCKYLGKTPRPITDFPD